MAKIFKWFVNYACFLVTLSLFQIEWNLKWVEVNTPSCMPPSLSFPSSLTLPMYSQTSLCLQMQRATTVPLGAVTGKNVCVYMYAHSRAHFPSWWRKAAAVQVIIDGMNCLEYIITERERECKLVICCCFCWSTICSKIFTNVITISIIFTMLNSQTV